MNKMTLEDLGWELQPGFDGYEAYKNGDQFIDIDYDKRKIVLSNNMQVLSFATLEAVREKVIEYAIY